MDIDTTLQSFGHFGVKLGLESSQHLLAQLGNPHERVPIIHVAGSNGKGSVCAYLSAILREAGYKVGRYTSPHLVDWNERICINEQPIPDPDLEAVVQQVIAAIPPNEPSPTQFEVITAAAWLYFAQQQVDIAVIEVGLGGRLDATNVCDRPLVSVIVSISREHWQRLGPTLADIAGEKAGILKPACPAVIGQLPPEARSVIDRRIADLNCPATYPEPATYVETKAVSFPPPTPYAQYQTLTYPLPLQGAIQLHNSALAIATLQILRQQGWHIPDGAIVNGMTNTRWAGRMQWFTWKDHTILIDGAHNPASAEALRQFVDRLGREKREEGREKKEEGREKKERDDLTSFAPLPHTPHSTPHTPTSWVLGMIATKDHADVFKALLRPGDRLYLTPVPDHITADPGDLAKLAQSICPELAVCQTFPDVFAALEAAIAESDQTPDTCSLVTLCGSLYLLGYFFKHAKQK